MSATNTQYLKNVSKMIRLIAVSEGVSYLILLTLSILKRTTSMDVQGGIRSIGMVHGILFMLFITAIGLGVYHLKWTYARAAWAFVASLLPFGTFILDSQLKKEEALIA